MDVKKGRCRVCIQSHSVEWSVDDDLWHKVMTDELVSAKIKYGGAICMTCFVKVAINMGMSPDRWRLSQDPDPEDTSWANEIIFKYHEELFSNFVKIPKPSSFIVKNMANEELMVIEDEEPVTDFTHFETIKDIPAGDLRHRAFTQSYEEGRAFWNETLTRITKELREELKKIVDEQERQILKGDQ